MRRKSSVIFLMIFLLTGCSSFEEADTKAYPIAVALDKEQNGIMLGVQFGKVIKGGEGATLTEEENTVIRCNGKSFYDAFEKLNLRTGKELSYAQLKAVVVSEELAREELMSLIYSLVNSYQVYPNLYVMIAQNSAVGYLDGQKIWLETTPSKFYELFYKKARRSAMNVMTVSQIAFRQVGEQGELVLPYITYVSDASSEEKSPEVEETAENFEKENVSAVTPAKSEITRLAVFRDGKMIDVIANEEVEAYGLLQGEFDRINLTVPIPEASGQFLNVYLENRTAPSKSVVLTNDIPYITVKLDLLVSGISQVSAPFYQQNPRQSEQLIEEYLQELCTQFAEKTAREYESDIFGFGQYAKANFLTYSQWQDYRWREKFPSAVFQILVSAKTYTNYEVILPQQQKGA